MKSLFVIVLASLVSYSYISVGSGSAVQSVLMPVIFLLSLLSMVCWVVVWRWNKHHASDRQMVFADLGIENELAAAHSQAEQTTDTSTTSSQNSEDWKPISTLTNSPLNSRTYS